MDNKEQRNAIEVCLKQDSERNCWDHTLLIKIDET